MITPALRSLKKRFPDAQIDLLVQFGVAPLAETFPNIHCIHSLPCGFLLRGGRRLAGVAAWFLKLFELRRNEYNLIIDFMGLFHSAAAAWMSRAPLRIGHRRDISLGYISLSTFGHFYTHEIGSEKEDHLADQMALLPAALGAPIDREGWEVVITAEMEKAAASRLHLDGADSEKGPFVLIHPGAKCPPAGGHPKFSPKLSTSSTEKESVPFSTQALEKRPSSRPYATTAIPTPSIFGLQFRWIRYGGC